MGILRDMHATFSSKQATPSDEQSTLAESAAKPAPCSACGGLEFWVDTFEVVRCWECHPAPGPAFVCGEISGMDSGGGSSGGGSGSMLSRSDMANVSMSTGRRNSWAIIVKRRVVVKRDVT